MSETNVMSELNEIHFFTDGAAKNNQAKTCVASWGVVCTKGSLINQSWNGKLLQEEKVMFKNNLESVRPTNIRAEGYAIIKVLELCNDLPENIDVKIMTDSQFWIDMLYNYIPNWVKKNINMEEKKNSDLVKKMYNLFIKHNKKINFVFVNAWHDRKEPNISDTLNYYNWTGNKLAEKTAETAL